MRRSGYRPKPVQMLRENGDIGGLQGRNQDDYDIKVFQYRKQQAELKRFASNCSLSGRLISLFQESAGRRFTRESSLLRYTSVHHRSRE